MTSKKLTRLRAIIVFIFLTIIVVESISILATKKGNLGVLLIAINVVSPYFHIKQQKH